MNTGYSRRSLLAGTVAVALGGCVGDDTDDSDEEGNDADGNDGDGSEDDSSSDSPSDSTDTTPTPEDSETDEGTPASATPDAESTPVPPDEREQLVEQLPETSPLSAQLVELVASHDRATTAEERGLEFRESSHSVRVLIELESTGELPTGYRTEVLDSYQNTVDAYVHVDDLVPVAMDENIRIIRPPAESRPHEPN